MSSSGLSVVSFVLRRQPSAGALQHLIPTISSFLGPSPHLPFHRAIDFGSVVLLDWIWSCSCPSVATRPSKWSLNNFLRSDPHYHRWEFSIAMEMAAGRGDLEIIKWMFSHFSDCKVPLEAVETAATNGHLAVLQYLLEHDTNKQEKARLSTKKRKVVTESGELVSVGDSPTTTKATQIVCWDISERYDRGGLVNVAIGNGHIEVARWLYSNIPTERAERKVRGAIEAALNRNDMALAESFVPRGQDVMQYAVFCTRNVEVVEHMIDSGYLQANSFFGTVAIKNLAATGRLDLMRRIENLKYSPRRNNTEWEKAWRDLLKIVSSRGDKAMIKWALGHPRGRRACRQLRRGGQLYQLLWNAVAGGCDVEVFQSLKDAGSIDRYGPALVEAVARNDMDSIKWLLDNFPQSEHISDYCVLDEAARRGYLHILKYFQSLPSAPGFVSSPTTTQKRDMDGAFQRSSSGGNVNVAYRDVYRNTLDDRHWQRSSWDSTDAMDNAAANGHSETVQWLHVNRTEGCTTDAMDCAAANGHLDVVKWLHTNRSEGLTTKAMDGAATNGHLHVVKWLHEHTRAGCTTKAMDGAAKHGHFSVVKWLHAHRSEGCTSTVVKKSLQSGHLSVASWFKRTFPHLRPEDVDLSFRERVSFPAALFIREHYPDLLTQELFGEYSFGYSSEDYLMDWVNEIGLGGNGDHQDDRMLEA